MLPFFYKETINLFFLCKNSKVQTRASHHLVSPKEHMRAHNPIWQKFLHVCLIFSAIQDYADELEVILEESHCLYTDLDGKKTTSHFQFTLPGVQGIHTNLKEKFFQISIKAFLENPLFVLWLTLTMDLADSGAFSDKF